jgi:hypothetical protein
MLTFETTATPLSATIVYNFPAPRRRAFATRAPAIQRLGDAPRDSFLLTALVLLVDQPSRLHQQPQHGLDLLEFLRRVLARVERRAGLVCWVFSPSHVLLAGQMRGRAAN